MTTVYILREHYAGYKMYTNDIMHKRTTHKINILWYNKIDVIKLSACVMNFHTATAARSYAHTRTRDTCTDDGTHDVRRPTDWGTKMIYLHINWTRPMAPYVTTPPTVHTTICDSRGGGTALVLTLLIGEIITVCLLRRQHTPGLEDAGASGFQFPVDGYGFRGSRVTDNDLYTNIYIYIF